MQIRLDIRLIYLIREPEYANLKARIFSIEQEQYPDWAVEVEGKADIYRFEVDGLVIIYRIDDTTAMERIIKIALLDEGDEDNLEKF